MEIRALKGKVLVTDLERGSTVVDGIIIPDDNGKSEGIRPRWGKVYALGSDVKDIKVGQWILVENHRWTRMIKFKDDNNNDVSIWGVEWPQAVMLVSDDEPERATWSQWS
jgi:co-chaperonin GroES (HSP10)